MSLPPHAPPSSLPHRLSWRLSLSFLGLTLLTLSCGPDPTVAREKLATLLGTGQQHWDRQQYSLALLPYEEALPLAQGLRDRKSEATALGRLGMIETDIKNPRKGLQYSAQALPIWEELGDVEEEVNSIYNIGVSYWALGDLEQALGYYDRALLRAKDLRKPPQVMNLVRADLLNAKGQICSERGEVDRALQLLQEALRLAHGDGITQGAVLAGLATLFRRTGEPQKALDTFSQALDLSLERQMVGKIHGYMAAAYRELGDLDKALACDRKALEIHRGLGSRRLEAITLADLGWIHLKKEEPEAGLKSFEQALQVTELDREDNRRARASALHGRGAALAALGREEEALPDLEAALDLRHALEDSLSQASVLLELGQVRQALGRTAAAAADFELALALARKIRAYTLEAESLFRLALLDRDRGRLPEAWQGVRQAMEIFEQVRANVVSPFLRSTFLASRRDYHELEIEVLMLLDGRQPGAGHQRAAFEASEKARARSLLDLLAEGELDVRRGLPADLKKREAEIGNELTRIQRRLLTELSVEEPKRYLIDELQQQLDEAEDRRARLEREIRSRHPRYAEVRYPEPLALPQAQALLDDRTALLEYFLGKERSYLFVVTRQGLTPYSLPREAEIEAQVRRVREGMVERGRRKLGGYKTAARELYRQLLAPAAGEIAGKRLLIAADEDLHLLAFEALLTAEAGDRPLQELPYLLREHAVTYVPSASVLAWLRRARPVPPAAAGRGGKQFLAFADPVLGPGNGGAAPRQEAATRGLFDGERGQLVPLPGSATEVERIARLFPPGASQLYLRGEATERNVKDNPLLRQASRIHFATHGVPDERQPDLAGLVLTPESDAEDGFLQVHEIFDLELSADLVVLSACETGLGRQVSGEGLLSLSRGFLYAGAPSVVVSLWRVSDQRSTPDLMERFYRGLGDIGGLGGADKSEALRQAKLAVIDGGHAHPYYWAPFVLIGDPDEPRR